MADIRSAASEQRLEQLRKEASGRGVVADRGVNVAGGPIPRGMGYYGQPVLKPPVWTWEIPIYLFIGGFGGMSAVIALPALVFHHSEVARTAMCLAVFAAIVSPILLILDLGRPRLFINMLRVFKHRSPMSMGAWILVSFSVCAVSGLIVLELHLHRTFVDGIDQMFRFFAGLFVAAAAFFGIFLSTYTGVLLGATAIPAWFLHRVFLPIHFGVAGLGSAAALLELFGHRIAPLNVLGFVAAVVESALFVWLMIDKHGAADRAIHQQTSGSLIRIAEILSGPIALVLRFFSFVPLAAFSFLIGALVSRFGWIAAGKVSGSDPAAVFAAERHS
jgi:formate-dependent nitrite reductase membrane component NrfD